MKQLEFLTYCVSYQILWSNIHQVPTLTDFPTLCLLSSDLKSLGIYNLTLLIAFTNCNKMGTTWGEKNVVLLINATIFFWKTFKSTQWILNHWFTCISPFSSGPHGWGVSPSADFNGWLEQLSNTSNTYKVSPCVGPLWGRDLNNNIISSKTSDHCHDKVRLWEVQ